MEWLTCIREAIDYMETHLEDIRSPQEVADHVHMSCMYLQKGFQVLTGYSLGEYMRSRRLYLAAVELSSSTVPVIDIALKSGYESQAAFDKAFTRFHGATPMEIRKGRGQIRSFLRMRAMINIQGGEHMQYRIEKKDSFKVVGFERTFSPETSHRDIPLFWDETIAAYAPNLQKRQAPQGDMETYVHDHRIGELGICIDDIPSGKAFRYMIAGYDKGGELPEGLTRAEIPAYTWAVFECTMATLQKTNDAIWSEWLPGNTAYELAGRYTLEWYSPDDMPGPDQKCEILIPVVAK